MKLYIVAYATTGEDLDITISTTRTQVFTDENKAKEHFNAIKAEMNSYNKEGEYEVIADNENAYTMSNFNNDGMNVQLFYQDI